MRARARCSSRTLPALGQVAAIRGAADRRDYLDGRVLRSLAVGDGWDRVKDGFHAAVDGGRGCLGDFLGEVLLAFAACGLLALGWWAFDVVPYLAISVGVGVLLLVAAGVTAYMRDVGGTQLVRLLAIAAVFAAGIVILVLSYLPNCSCIG